MEDGQGRGTRRIQGGGAIEALKKAAMGHLLGAEGLGPQIRNSHDQRYHDVSEEQAELSSQ